MAEQATAKTESLYVANGKLYNDGKVYNVGDSAPSLSKEQKDRMLKRGTLTKEKPKGSSS